MHHDFALKLDRVGHSLNRVIIHFCMMYNVLNRLTLVSDSD